LTQLTALVLPGIRPRLGVAAVALHAQAQRFDAGEGVPTVEGRLARAEVAQHLHARLDGEGRQPDAHQVGVLQP
jgi:hypothetical protein